MLDRSDSEIAFPVVGEEWVEGAKEKSSALSVGTPLSLRRNEANSDWPNGIAVLADGVQIGYVPDKGWSCTICWRPIKTGARNCSNCGSDSTQWVPGGLATRLINRNVLDTCVCYVSELKKTGLRVWAKVLIPTLPISPPLI